MLQETPPLCAVFSNVSVFTHLRETIDPQAPTSAPAGSPEKVAVLTARFAARLPLFHPDDNPRIYSPPDDEEYWIECDPDEVELDLS